MKDTAPMTDDLQNNCAQDKGDDMPKATLWMPWFIKDHRAAASTLDHIEHSALCYLQMLLWEHGGTFPDDDKKLARAVKLSVPKWRAIREVVLAGCEIEGGLIRSTFLIAEFAKAQNNIKQKSGAGKRSGEVRRERTAVKRALNGCSNGGATASEPRAGGGVGDGTMEGIGGGATFDGIEEDWSRG